MTCLWSRVSSRARTKPQIFTFQLNPLSTVLCLLLNTHCVSLNNCFSFTWFSCFSSLFHHKRRKKFYAIGKEDLVSNYHVTNWSLEFSTTLVPGASTPTVVECSGWACGLLSQAASELESKLCIGPVLNLFRSQFPPCQLVIIRYLSTL